MSANDLKREFVSYIDNSDDEELLSLLKESFVFYSRVKDADITYNVNDEELNELSEENERIDVYS